MANTTWNPSDKTASMTLGGTNNLTATSGSTNQAVRTIDRQDAGQFYFEITATSPASGTNIGVANQWVAIGSVAAAALNAMVITQSTGGIYVNNVAAGPTIGAISSGNIVCIAIDLGAQLIWFRNGAAGNWNGVAANNPATGIGGVNIAGFGGAGIPIYPLVTCTTSGPSFTGNFGDSAFSGAVPSGFTAGFTAGTAVPTNAMDTQFALEQWASVTTGSTLAQLTQLGLEHWATVAMASGTTAAAQARAIILA